MAINTRIWIGFAVSLLTLSLVFFSGYRATQHAIERSYWVDHTYEVASLIDTVIKQFNDVETGQRGYLLTGKLSYLEPYESGISGIPSTLSRARNLTTDNPRQQRRVDQIESLYSEKLLELEETIDFYNAGDQAKAFEIVLTDRGKRVMDDIRAVIQEMKAEEERLLTTRKQESESAVLKIIFIGSFGGALVLLSILVAGAAFMRGNTRRYLLEHNQAEQALRNEVVNLEHSLSESHALPGQVHVCTQCHAIRDEQGEWEKLQAFLSTHSNGELSHGICTECTAPNSRR